MLKIRWSCDRLIFNMGIPIPGKDSLYIETGPRLRQHCHQLPVVEQAQTQSVKIICTLGVVSNDITLTK